MMDFTLKTEPGSVPYLVLPGFGSVQGQQGVRLVFTTRRGGISSGAYAELNLGLSAGDDPELVAENRRLLCKTLGLDAEKLSIVKQVHSDRVVVVDKIRDRDSPIIEADAQVTAIPDLPLFGLFADCLAVYLYDPVHGVIGLAHAGWRGTVAAIVRKTVAVMTEQFGTRPEHCHAALAPAAGPCCYEVGDEVAEAARTVFPAEWPVLRPRCQDGEINRRTPESQGKWTFDLWEGNARWLLEAGLKRENIIISGLCTICRQDLFFSYRGSGGCTGRMAALIMLPGAREKIIGTGQWETLTPKPKGDLLL
jgi:YfiH family protein